MLVLLALRLAPPASVAAVRETSIVIAVALAAIVLRERIGALRAGGAHSSLPVSGCYPSDTTFRGWFEMGARRPFFVKGLQMAKVHDKERSLQREIGIRVEDTFPDVEVLAVELSGPERFTVFIDRVGAKVDHALCARVTDVLRDYLREYTVDVSSPGLERPLRKPQHFRNVVGRRVTLRTESRKRLRGEVVDAGDRAVTVQTDNESVQVPYEEILRGNLIDER